MTTKSLTTEEIEHTQKKMREYASDTTVGLCGRKPEHETVVNGSGTFVRFRDKYGVLTAAHVWEKELKKFNSLQFLIDDRHPKDSRYTKICVDLNDNNVHAWLPADWLPKGDPTIKNTKDICFLQILNPDIISTLKSKCSFYPLEPQPLRTIDAPKREGWMLAGFPYQIQPQGRLKRVLFCHPTGLKQYHQWDSQWDRLSFDLSSIKQEMDVTSVGGMSGGPVWAFQIVRWSETGEVALGPNRGDCFLAGVSYYETKSQGQVREVLANGPNSIYSGLISRIESQA